MTIERYTRPEMRDIWSQQTKYESWLKVEIEACQAWANLGEISQEDVDKIRENATFTVERIAEIEEETRHDVVAFTRCVSESLGNESKWIHYGLTSTDVVDTAYGYQLKQVNAILKNDLQHLMAVVGKKAKEHKYTIQIGRTHGVHAEPTTFGLKLAGFYAELKRHQERFELASQEVEAGKISGAVGTFANTPPEVEAYVCEQLGIRAQDISTQVLPRDLHAHYVATIALIGTSIERFATEIRSLQKTETREVEEFFAAGQKGSSAMPHKRNPIGSENVTGLARVMRGYIIPAYENVSLWHERDISHSSAERIILPDITTLLNYQLNRFAKIIEQLTVLPENMLSNMDKTYGLIYSQRVMLLLIDKGLTREEAYDTVQPLTKIAWDEKLSFIDLVHADETINEKISKAELNKLFDPKYHLSQVDTLFKRVGLED
ncbi:adenylosuccinate lyase [Fundicoccus culcitae]|uniref:Adenylosuccinate lyase n=1 Tax=Fundicoccus culcitae TaxID=2969821 RepID=A0ABY5P6Z6_9LACT|nr:adenylosuccinate lyase [Fundicoccus culcitae]UUX34512.1 adenylosuccinate lyase [Fundicoccus culcitae]